MSDSTRNSDTRQVAREQSSQLKGSAQGAASNVAGTAGERAREIRQQAGTHAKGVANEAGRQMRDRAQQETERAGTALSNAGSQLQALAEGRTDDAGVFGDYTRQAADAVNRWADSVQDRGFDGLVDDVRTYARRRPGMFLLGAVAAGLVAGRLGRNLREEMSDDDTSAGQSNTGSQSFSGSQGATAGTPAGNRTAQIPGSASGGEAQSTTPPSTPPPASADRSRDDVIVGRQQVDPATESRDDRVDYEPADVNQRRMS